MGIIANRNNKIISKQSESSILFDGVNDYVSFGSITQNITQVTFEAWAYPTAYSSWGAVIGNFYHSLNKGINIVPRSTTTMGISWGDGVNAYPNSVPSGTNMTVPVGIPLNKWSHIALSFNGTTISLFINAVLVYSIDRPVFLGDTHTGLGRWSAQYGAYYYSGHIGMSRVWNKALSAQEIENNLFRQLNQDTPNLIEQWIVDSVSGTSLKGTKNMNGIIYGGASLSKDVSLNRNVALSTKDNTSYALGLYSNADIQLPNDIGYTDKFSAFAWFKSSGIAPGNHHIIFGGEELEISIPTTGVDIGKLRMGVKCTSRHVINVGTAGVLTNGAWHLIGITYENNLLKGYIDGLFVGQVSTTGVLRNIFSNRTIGRWGSNTQYYLNGQLDDMRIYKRVITSDEILSLIKKKPVNNGLILHYKPNINIKNKLVDLSGLGNDGIFGSNVSIIESTAPVNLRSCLNFDGVDDYVSLGNLPISSTANTIDFWFKIANESITSSFMRLFSAQSQTSQSVTLGFTHTNHLSFWDGGKWNQISTTTLSKGVWIHVALVKTNTQMLTYIDDVLHTTINASGLNYNMFTLGQPFLSGGTYYGQYFKGSVANFRIWDKGLLETELKSVRYNYAPSYTPNLAEQWTLNEGVGNMVFGDKGNNGSLVGFDTSAWSMPSSANWKSTSISLSGTGQFITVGDRPSLQISGSQTIEMWLKPANFSQRRNPYAKAYGGEGTITQETNGTLNYYWGTSGINGGTYQGFGSSTSLTLNVWNHIALVRDLEQGKLFWYINGILTSQTNAAYAAATTGTQPVYIGNGYTTVYAGEIDEVRVWDTPRTQDDIQKYMALPIDFKKQNLKGYWRMDDLTGLLAWDASGYANHGTVTGGTFVSCDNEKLQYNPPIN
jgi:hypothetical protein